MKRLTLIIFSAHLLACSESANTKNSSSQTSTGKPLLSRIPAALPDTSRFKKIRKLLGKDPNAPDRAYHLYPLIDPVCTSTEARIKFVADAAAFVEVREDPTDRGNARRIAIDIIEHVSTSCWRNHPRAAFQVLSGASKIISDTSRFDVITARLRAAAGEFELAMAAAEKAKEKGSIHAIALLANISAQLARQKSPNYTEGMLEPAIKLVSVAPGANWPLIDLTAVLSTRVRLLAERANWESEDKRVATLKDARNTLGRLSVGPFIELTRRHALDSLCYDSVLIGSDSTQPCIRAASEHQNLGAAFLAGNEIAPPAFDRDRYNAITAARSRIDEMKADKLIVLAVRGDEQEVIAWTRPAATVLSRLAPKKPILVVIDRTYSKRASATVDRILELAKLKPTLRIQAGRDTFAMPCLTALVAGRKAPKSCPFDKALISKLIKLPPYEYGFLVGRDLDAEIDDLRLYELDAALLSYRKSLSRKGLPVHFKDLSDAWIFAPNAPQLAGSMKANAKQ